MTAPSSPTRGQPSSRCAPADYALAGKASSLMVSGAERPIWRSLLRAVCQWVFPGRRPCQGIRERVPCREVHARVSSVSCAQHGWPVAPAAVCSPEGCRGIAGMSWPRGCDWLPRDHGLGVACSGGRCCQAPPGCPCPVQDHRHGGGDDRGRDGDEHDLPAGHAAGDDGVHLGWRLYRPAEVARWRHLGG